MTTEKPDFDLEAAIQTELDSHPAEDSDLPNHDNRRAVGCGDRRTASIANDAVYAVYCILRT